MNYCPSCGTKVEPDWNICPDCGYNLKSERGDYHQPQPSYITQPPQMTQPTPQYQPPKQPYYAGGQQNVYGIIAIVFGILGLCIFFYGIGFVFGIIAIILGGIGQGKDDNPSMAVGGVVLGIIDIVCGLIFLPFLFFPFFFFWPF